VRCRDIREQISVVRKKEWEADQGSRDPFDCAAWRARMRRTG